jgi:arylformamidase
VSQVYKQYDQDGLDNQYNNRLHVPDYANYFKRWDLLSTQTEQKLQVIKDVRYGDLHRERLDIYPSFQAQSKTLIFIHGGYWQLLDKSMFQFIADGFHSYGITTVLLNYPLAPEDPIDQIVTSCRKAISWLYSNISEFNGDPHQMYVAGHSAGGHLAAMLSATDWNLFNYGLSTPVLRGICAVSGLFNLVPIHLCYVNEVLKMDLDTAKRNSPMWLEPLNLCSLLIAVGKEETAEFKDQSREFYTSWKNKGTNIKLLQLPAQNHYSVADTIVDAESPLHKALLQLMQIE